MILIFAADDKFMNGTCRLKKIFQSIFRSSAMISLEIKLFHEIKLFQERTFRHNSNNCM